MKSSASAVWNGSLKDGSGKISATSGVLNNSPFSFMTRFEGAKGTNPEELIAAAHSACFSMATSAELGKASITPEAIQTTATVVLEKNDAGFAITESNLVCTITAPGADQEKIRAAAAGAKENCPISKLLNAKINLELKIN